MKSTVTDLIEKIRTSESPWTLLYSILKSSEAPSALQKAMESRVPDIAQAISTAEDPIEIARYVKGVVYLASNPLIAGAAEERIGDIAATIASAATDYRLDVHLIIDRIASIPVLCNSPEIHEAIDDAADDLLAMIVDEDNVGLCLLLDRLAKYDCLAKHSQIQSTSAKIIAVMPWATRYITRSECLLSSPKVLEAILRSPESAATVLERRPDFKYGTRLAECVAQAIYKGYGPHMTPAIAKRAHKYLWKFESIRKALLER